MRKKSLAAVLREVDPELKVVGGRKRGPGRRLTLGEFQASTEPDVGERIRDNPAPQRKVRDYDDNWNPGEALVCPICRKTVGELLPYGYTGKRMVCRECIERRKKLLEYKSRLFAQRPSIRRITTRRELERYLRGLRE